VPAARADEVAGFAPVRNAASMARISPMPTHASRRRFCGRRSP